MDLRSMPADSSSRSVEIRAILITFSILSTITVALRVYVRYKVLHSLGWDDRVMVAAQFLATGSAVAIGLGRFYFCHNDLTTIDILRSGYHGRLDNYNRLP
uniref:Integral membrane protein n=1 Tax=Fusarium oxysporum (strain Fo5176) TaxID=660025 RepID=A0A0D2YCW1_FUSOF